MKKWPTTESIKNAMNIISHPHHSEECRKSNPKEVTKKSGFTCRCDWLDRFEKECKRHNLKLTYRNDSN